MEIKIVILNWNGRAHLERFLPSVVSHSTGASVVVADNGSDDDSAAFLRKHYPQVELLLLDKNYGYAEGYNRALEQVAADCYVLLNSDVEVEEGWLGPLAKLMASNERIAALAPKILSYDRPGYFEYAGASGGFLDAFGYPFCRGRILDTIEQDDGQYDTSRDVFWASGACMMVRADVFRKLGGFDGDFFAHMEEIDFCWRAQLAGYRIMVEPRSRVFHLGGGTLPNNSPRKLYLNYRNNLSMLYKNLSKRHVMAAALYEDGARRDVRIRFSDAGQAGFFQGGVPFAHGFLQDPRHASRQAPCDPARPDGVGCREHLPRQHHPAACSGPPYVRPDDVIIASAPG